MGYTLYAIYTPLASVLKETQQLTELTKPPKVLLYPVDVGAEPCAAWWRSKESWPAVLL